MAGTSGSCDGHEPGRFDTGAVPGRRAATVCNLVGCLPPSDAAVAKPTHASSSGHGNALTFSAAPLVPADPTPTSCSPGTQVPPSQHVPRGRGCTPSRAYVRARVRADRTPRNPPPARSQAPPCSSRSRGRANVRLLDRAVAVTAIGRRWRSSPSARRPPGRLGSCGARICSSRAWYRRLRRAEAPRRGNDTHSREHGLNALRSRCTPSERPAW